ncbi:MAG: hypothetical protein OEL19_02440 [Sulfurimonas sp.]|nr:hypothetical protein [Sulfurimonas sp.]
MSKAIQALLTGMFITFVLDFFLFLGIFLHYTEHYEVGVYYNILFADNQNWYLFFTLSVVLGYIVVYVKNSKISLIPIPLVALFVSLTLFENVGYKAGEAMFMKKNITIKIKRHSYVGDIIYNGREKITFYSYNLKKTVTFDKKDLVQ